MRRFGVDDEDEFHETRDRLLDELADRLGDQGDPEVIGNVGLLLDWRWSYSTAELDPTLSAVTAALRDAGASFAFIHGSVAEGRARADSDLDIAAWWDTDPPASFAVDLPAGVDLLVLNTAPLELAGRVAASGQLLFEAAPEVRVRWQATTRKIYFDELPRLTRSHREFSESVRSGR